MMFRLRAFLKDRRGNVAIIFAFVLTILIAVAGLMVDYAVAVHRKKSMDNAVDVALLAGVTAASQAFRDEKANWATIGQDTATAMFRANLPPQSNYKELSFQATITQEGPQLKGRATYTGQSFTSFMQFFNKQTVDLSGDITVVTGLPNFIDIHFVVDVSSSMGIGASTADQKKMDDGTKCAFACHQGFGVNDTRYTPQTMNLLGATLRIDIIRRAILNVVDRLKEMNIEENNVRIAIYAVSENLTVLSELSSNLGIVRAQAAKIDLTKGNNGGSYLSKGLEDVNAKLGQGGTGRSRTNRLSYVVFLSDGVDDTSTSRYTGNSASLIANKLPGWRATTPSGQPADAAWLQAFSPSACLAMKSKGHHVVAVQIKYVATTSFTRNSVDLKKVNYIDQTLRTPLVNAFKACGTDGYKEAADSPAIDPVLQEIVDEVILPNIARLSN